MKTIKAEYLIQPKISYICTECGEFNRYSKIGGKPELVECSKCGEVFVPDWRS